MRNGDFTLRRITAKERGYSYDTFQVVGYLNGERIRKRFKTREGALGELNRLQVKAANESHGLRAVATTLTPEQVRVAELAFKIAPDLLGAVQWYAANYRPPAADTPLADVLAADGTVASPGAISAFLADRKPHISEFQFKDYKRNLDAFAARFPGRTVASVKTEEIAAYFAELKMAKKSFNNRRGNLNAFFRFCAARPRAWTRENPVEPIAKFRISRGLPEILSSEQAAKLMEFVEGYAGPEGCGKQPGFMVPYFALCLFAGLRPSVSGGEIRKLADANPEKLISRDLGVIRITPEISKVRRIRLVKIRPNLAAWLERYPIERFPIIPPNAQERITEIRKRFGLGDDVLRHTYISAHVAAFKSLGEAALEAGNSEAIIRNHYPRRARAAGRGRRRHLDAQANQRRAAVRRTHEVARGKSPRRCVPALRTNCPRRSLQTGD